MSATNLLEQPRLQPVQFEWENEPQRRAVRLVSGSARVDDPVRVTAAGVEVEGRIRQVEGARWSSVVLTVTDLFSVVTAKSAR